MSQTTFITALRRKVRSRRVTRDRAAFAVYRVEAGRWRFTNFRDIAGDCDSWAKAYDEAFAIATSMRAEATA